MGSLSIITGVGASCVSLEKELDVVYYETIKYEKTLLYISVVDIIILVYNNEEAHDYGHMI